MTIRGGNRHKRGGRARPKQPLIHKRGELVETNPENNNCAVIPRACVICSRPVTSHNPRRKTCSKQCAEINVRNMANAYYASSAAKARAARSIARFLVGMASGNPGVRKCVVCSSAIAPSRSFHAKTCSGKCARELHTQRSRENALKKRERKKAGHAGRAKPSREAELMAAWAELNSRPQCVERANRIQAMLAARGIAWPPPQNGGSQHAEAFQ